MHRFSTQNLREVFAEENKFENFRTVASNLVRGIDTYELDEDGNERKLSKTQTNKAIRKVFMDICNLTENDLTSKKKRHRAEKAHILEIFEVIEDDVDFMINEGFQETEWFNDICDSRNIALGDQNAFYVEDNQLLIVSNTSGDHHDVTIQQAIPGREIVVKTTSHSVKIGKDIDLIILGRYDYTKMINKIAESYIKDIQNLVCTNMYAAVDKLPAGAGLTMTSVLDASTKADFDELIETVEAVNGTEVILVGTKVALKKLTAIADVDWASEDQKISIANTGRLGSYEGTSIMEIPQRLTTDGTFGKLISNDVILVIPVREDKFVKFVDEGETEIVEYSDKGDKKDDFETYEVNRNYGAEVVLGQYFGAWRKA